MALAAVEWEGMAEAVEAGANDYLTAAAACKGGGAALPIAAMVAIHPGASGCGVSTEGVRNNQTIAKTPAKKTPRGRRWPG